MSKLPHLAEDPICAAHLRCGVVPTVVAAVDAGQVHVGRAEQRAELAANARVRWSGGVCDPPTHTRTQETEIKQEEEEEEEEDRSAS